MSKQIVFCSTQRIPNEEFPESLLVSLAGLSMMNAVGCRLKSKSGWKSFLTNEEVGEIVLLGVDDPSEYEVPLEDLTDILTYAGDYLIPTKCQIVNKKIVLVVPPAASFNPRK